MITCLNNILDTCDLENNISITCFFLVSNTFAEKLQIQMEFTLHVNAGLNPTHFSNLIKTLLLPQSSPVTQRGKFLFPETFVLVDC